jgi:hypothetical protein
MVRGRVLEVLVLEDLGVLEAPILVRHFICSHGFQSFHGSFLLY